MKKLFLLVCLIQSSLFGQDTFSIIAIDTSTGAVGSAGASCINSLSIPGGCVVISHIQPGRGGIHTQAQYLATNKQYGISLMQRGKLPREILDSLTTYDAGGDSTVRQYGAVVWDNGQLYADAYTGSACFDYKNHIVGPNYSIQGNILSGQAILDSMEARFLRAEGDLACRLMEALEGANVPGADARCLNRGISSLSAFLRVARPTDTLGGFQYEVNLPYVSSGIEPIDSLRALFELAGGCVAVSKLPDVNRKEIQVVYQSYDQKLLISGPTTSKARLRICNIQGQQVVLDQIQIPGQVDCSNYPSGWWIYTIQGEGNSSKSGKYFILNK
jgi:uncharacterized Ntn-hydrolase superfamily protein